MKWYRILYVRHISLEEMRWSFVLQDALSIFAAKNACGNLRKKNVSSQMINHLVDEDWLQ
jgi:hypothetical protein